MKNLSLRNLLSYGHKFYSANQNAKINEFCKEFINKNGDQRAFDVRDDLVKEIIERLVGEPVEIKRNHKGSLSSEWYHAISMFEYEVGLPKLAYLLYSRGDKKLKDIEELNNLDSPLLAECSGSWRSLGKDGGTRHS